MSAHHILELTVLSTLAWLLWENRKPFIDFVKWLDLTVLELEQNRNDVIYWKSQSTFWQEQTNYYRQLYKQEQNKHLSKKASSYGILESMFNTPKV